jgi:hypothetical protein
MKPLSLLLCVVVSSASVFAQEPTPPASTGSQTSTAPAQQPSSSSTQTSSKNKALPSFLIVGTVFNEKALSFPGAQVRIRRTDEKKFRWETYTNSRGEFAVRVYPGSKYEVVVHVKKYQDQAEIVDATVDVQQRLSIKLEPVNHPEAKP